MVKKVDFFRQLPSLVLNILKMEMRLHMHGKGNRDILKYVFNRELSANDVNKYTQEKESIISGFGFI